MLYQGDQSVKKHFPLTRSSHKLFGNQLEIAHAFLTAFLKHPKGRHEIGKLFDKFNQTDFDHEDFFEILRSEEGDRLTTVVSVSIASDVLFLATSSLMADFSLERQELKAAIPIIQPFVSVLAQNLFRYHKFVRPLTISKLKEFAIEFSQDEKPFGMCCQDTLLASLRIVSAADGLAPKYSALQNYSSVLIRFIRAVLVSGAPNKHESTKYKSLRDLLHAAQLETGINYGFEIDLALPGDLFNKFIPPEDGQTNAAILESIHKSKKAKSQHENDDFLDSIDTSQFEKGPTPTRKANGPVEEAMNELNSMVGLDEIKAEISKLVSFLKIQQIRTNRGLPVQKQTLHFVFLGNPGTGKTTVARIIGKLLYGLKYLKSSNFKEADRSKLVAEYVGQTAVKTNKLIDEALGGVLFIDEAYSLVNSGASSSDGFGMESVATLLKRMEDDREQLCVIAAGYTAPMDVFLKSNPGLKSRFTRRINFPDFNADSLLRIFRVFAKKEEYHLTDSFVHKLAAVLTVAWLHRDKTFGNARFVRSLFEQIIGQHCHRISAIENLSDEDLTTLREQDLVISDALNVNFDYLKLLWFTECPKCSQDYTGKDQHLFSTLACQKCGEKVQFSTLKLDRRSEAMVMNLKPVFNF